ncbi:MAG: membrane protein insertase YidC [Candidatus Omnitrophica bacterium]|nr:membrane protein insertase YidC [Candidatus Omnitrophota bacterium]
MEKRLVLSFVLSFLVLYLWAMMAPKTPESPDLAASLNATETTTDLPAETVNVSATAAPTSAPAEATPTEYFHIENDQLEITFANVGGGLAHIHLKEYDEPLPVDHIGGFQEYSQRTFQVVRQEPRLLEFRLVDDDLSVSRIYSLAEEGYTLQVTDKVTNRGKMSKDVRLDIIGFTLNMRDGPNGHHPNKPKTSGPAENRDRGLNEYAVNSTKGIKRKNNAYKFGPKDEKSQEGPVTWLAFRNRYYATIVKPEFETAGYAQRVIEEHVLQLHLNAATYKLAPAESRDYNYTVFIGPERTELLKEYGGDFDKIKRYYKLGLFDAIAKLIGGLMKVLYGVIPNWGVCIILISIVIYYSMYPLTAKGMASMKRMQALQPKIQQLKERYEDNPQKLNQEMLELYRREKINPLGGCLPMLFQMPVFIGLYQVLWRNVDFKGAHFLWIKDLSQPDRLFTLDFSLPVIGTDINLLPILMIIIMAVQQRFSAKNMTVADPVQQQQQKMMMTVMPLLLGFIFYKFASGLTLYFTMFYIFSTITQWKISKEPKVTNA